MAAEGRFRADLYDRLNILNLEIVPFRHQKEKIKHLLLERLNAEQFGVGRAEMFEISVDAVSVLEDYDGRGDFRELVNFAARLAGECFDDAVITAESVRKVLQREQGNNSIKEFNSAEQSNAATGAGKTFDEFSITSNLVAVTFDLESDDLDTIYLKVAGNVIQQKLTLRIQSRRQNCLPPDRTVPEQSRQFAEKILASGGQARAIIYPDFGHQIRVTVRNRDVDPFIDSTLK